MRDSVTLAILGSIVIVVLIVVFKIPVGNPAPNDPDVAFRQVQHKVGADLTQAVHKIQHDLARMEHNVGTKADLFDKFQATLSKNADTFDLFAPELVIENSRSVPRLKILRSLEAQADKAGYDLDDVEPRPNGSRIRFVRKGKVGTTRNTSVWIEGHEEGKKANLQSMLIESGFTFFELRDLFEKPSQVIKKYISRGYAEEWKKALEQAGATVSLR